MGITYIRYVIIIYTLNRNNNKNGCSILCEFSYILAGKAMMFSQNDKCEINLS